MLFMLYIGFLVLLFQKTGQEKDFRAGRFKVFESVIDLKSIEEVEKLLLKESTLNN